MKQHITVEQLKELEDLQIIELLFKNSPNRGNVISNRQKAKDSDIWHKWICKYVTIGKMIDILNNHEDVLYIQMETPTKHYPDYLVSVVYKFKSTRIDFEITCGELADALWQAVKYVLESD